MMPRCTSAVPPITVAAREYHHSARAVSNSAPPRPVQVLPQPAPHQPLDADQQFGELGDVLFPVPGHPSI